MRGVLKFLAWLTALGIFGLVAAIGGIVVLLQVYGENLPDYEKLTEYSPDVATRIYAADGRLLNEFATERRVFVPIRAIPDQVKEAFISAEDKNFYTHTGIDPVGVARAIVTNLKNYGSGRRPEGASTITQQVAKNFLLTNEVSYERKIKEALIALKLEQRLEKDQILELYLNEIYLGQGTYGVTAAALHYFDKALDELNVQEAAFLAALPKAPNNYNPVTKREAALERRNWVLDRLYDDGKITKKERNEAQESELRVSEKLRRGFDADYFAEEIRRFLDRQYGEDALYRGGLVVRTTLDADLQKIVAEELKKGLLSFDRSKGYRGPIQSFGGTADWVQKLSEIKEPAGAEDWSLAILLNASGEIGVRGVGKAKLLDEDVAWAGSSLKTGDVILVQKTADTEDYHLRQLPKVQGGAVAIDPHTGRVLAMQGGFSYAMSEFNRATQAKRQPGSAFKPFVYLTALENGMTPSTLVLDSPMEIDQGPGLPKWRPANYSEEFYGLTPLRVGLEKSRNVMTVRMAQYLGMDKIIDTAKRFGIDYNLQPYLAASLGSNEVTLLELTNAYAMLVNGGKKMAPRLVDRVQDRYGKTVFVSDQRPCLACGERITWERQPVPEIPDTREQIADPRAVYQVLSLLQGAVQRGTGVRIGRALDTPIGGKTGTTNDSKDTWFIGFTPDLVVGVFVGYDEPKPLGKKATGASVAAPIFLGIMQRALEGTPATPFRVPSGLKMVRINPHTGKLAGYDDQDTIWETYVPGTEPGESEMVLDEMGLRKIPAYSLNQGGYGYYQGTGMEGRFIGNDGWHYGPYGTQGGAASVPQIAPVRNPTDVNTGTGGLY